MPMNPAALRRGAAIIERQGDVVEYHSYQGPVFPMKVKIQILSEYVDRLGRQGVIEQVPQMKVHPAFFPKEYPDFVPQQGDEAVYEGVTYYVNAKQQGGLGIIRLLIDER